MTQAKPLGALNGVRVLEISSLAGAACGRVLADLGASVIKIEPQGGEKARFDAPLVPTKLGQESASWLAFNFGKKSVVIDLDTPAGLADFRALAADADIVVSDFRRLSLADMDRLEASARAANPAVIWTEILPFGRGHAYEAMPATDTTLQALGGHLFQNGDIDRPPVRIGLPVGLLQAGAEAASAALMAYYHALKTGEGQRVDISVQEVVIWTLLNTTMAWQILSLNEMRGGAIRKERANRFFTRLVWPCKDGSFVFGPVGGGGGSARIKSYEALLKWMEEDGVTDEILRRHDWNGDGQFAIPQDDYDAVTDVIKRFIETKTSEELIERSVRDRILMAPINSIRDIFENVQFRSRGLFKSLSDEARDLDVELPANWVRMSATAVADMAPPPVVGADTDDVLGTARRLREAS
ncbi:MULTISPECIES: CoA transferase [Alphaproteobacteria]|uniref:CoA transferase n=2 Tax=Alphaproteobacteria TaxID=28211 RepID=A0A512HNN7_9HYPH|nr:MULTISPECIES: CoA transferase [Alphaproteobacteria]GEO87053.1 CoA transferase [Ciceribacter naphthalenivorans]GLR23161.1 CoA transferase [Ciceribacter naphthalenivorans]GLT06017.1 CoA transferase [Sphingomonas psychrolutea]